MRDDKISLPRVKLLHPAIAGEVELLIDTAEAGFPEHISIRIAQGLRSFDDQEALYQKGRTTAGPRLTNAPPGRSYHEYGLAIDGVILVHGKPDWKSMYWKEVVKIFINAEYTWGADWDCDGITKEQGDTDEHLVDTPHLEKSFGYSTRQLLVRYHNGLFIPHTKYLAL